MNNDRYAMAEAIYERTMWRLRVTIRLLTAVLLGLIAHSVIDGLNIADLITGTVISLLLITSVGLWRQGRRVRPDAGSRYTGSDDDKSARTRGMSCVP